MLPADLRTAEVEALAAVQAALAAGQRGLWTVEFRFEGLRIMPVALRMLAALTPAHAGIRLLFPDAGATALAKRDAPEQAAQLSSLGDLMRLQQADGAQALHVLGAHRGFHVFGDLVFQAHGVDLIKKWAETEKPA